MAEISKIKLPSGNTYDLKDATARAAIAALEGGSYFLGVTTTALTDGSTTNPISIGGTNVTAKNGNMVIYGNKEFVWYAPASGTAKWVEFGDLSTLGSLAYKSTVSLNKGTAAKVLGTGTTFANAASAVSFAAHTTDKVLGEATTFSASIATKSFSPTKKRLSADVTNPSVSAPTSAAITALGTPSTATFVKSYPGATSKLVTTSVYSITGVGSASTWSFAMGSGADAETLIISGGNSTVPTRSAVTVATGSLAANGGGSSVMTGLGTASTGSAVTGLGTPTTGNFVTGVSLVSLTGVNLVLSDIPSGGAAEVGKVDVAIGGSISVSDPTITVGTNDKVTAITALGAATAAAQTITVTKSEVSVAEHGNLSVTVS